MFPCMLQTLEELEAEMLNGQKLQGPPTAAEVNSVLRQRGMEEQYVCYLSYIVCVSCVRYVPCEAKKNCTILFSQ